MKGVSTTRGAGAEESFFFYHDNVVLNTRKFLCCRCVVNRDRVGIEPWLSDLDKYFKAYVTESQL